MLNEILEYSRSAEGNTEGGLLTIAIYADLAARDALDELNSDAESFLGGKLK